jgi:hypothetical protein
MLNKVKNYGLIVLAVFCLILAWQVNHFIAKYQDEKANRERLWNNNMELMALNRTQTNLVLTKDEFIKVLTDSTAALLNRLKIAPKQVTKIIEKTVTVTDTIEKPVPVFIVGQNFWKIKDSGPCFKWQADAFLRDDSLQINRTLFDYKNKTIDVFSRQLKGRFLFFKFYSRKEVVMQSVSECGESYTKTVEVKR